MGRFFLNLWLAKKSRIVKQIKKALISVYNKDGIIEIASLLHKEGVEILSTGGTASFLEEGGIPVSKVEDLTHYPSILGGRVKTLHPAVFGGILGRRDNPSDQEEFSRFHFPTANTSSGMKTVQTRPIA